MKQEMVNIPQEGVWQDTLDKKRDFMFELTRKEFIICRQDREGHLLQKS